MAASKAATQKLTGGSSMTSKTFAVWTKAALVACLAVFVAFGSLSFGQQLTGTLSGTTMDSSGAVVANAKVTMKNELSGDVRTTVSNGSGYFSITAVQPGTYNVTVAATGFKAWSQSGIVFAQGDNRTLPNIALQVGGVNETVEITAGALAVPTDNAEVSTTLNQTLVTDVPILGRDAGELLKLMPGMAAANGINNGNSFSDKVVGTNTGPVGSFSSNGTQPNGAMAFMLDGANLVDPGNAGTQIANINQDMVSEVKVLMASYSAEYAKGPVIFQAFSKSGGSSFHGEGYLYARNSAMNSIDAYTHSQIANGSTTAAKAAPDENYYYAGGNIGGPIRLPFTGFNKDRNKLFFWAGYEYMRQHPAGTILNYNVPTPEQKAGDFSETTIEGIPGNTAVSDCGGATTLLSCLQGGGLWQYAYNIPFNFTQLSPSAFDPNIGGILNATSYLKQHYYPDPNITPSSGNGWNNYSFVNQAPQNRWEATGKVDYAINENTKLTGSYTRQIEADQHPISIWWEPAWNLPYPSPIVANTTSQEIMANFTHVFSPTTTNEFVFTYARYINPSALGQPDAVDRSTLGFNVQGLFGHTTSQIPNFLAPWGGAFPQLATVSFTAGFGHGNTFGALKSDPSVYDNFTRVIGSHTLKFGAYWDTNGNVQSQGDQQHSDNGAYQLGWGPSSTGNVVADWLLGGTANYVQPSSAPGTTVKNHQYSIYAQDSYKANRQLTLNYGLRADHIGQWYGPPNGAQVWCGSCYVNGTSTTPIPSHLEDPSDPNSATIIDFPNTGFTWHAINSHIPVSGFESPLFYYQPRIGLAYDVFGTGKTVLRSGFAMFRYQFAINDVNGSFNGPLGIFSFQTAGTVPYTGAPDTGYAQINSGATGFVPPSGSVQNGADGIQVMQAGDNRTPYVMDWNVTISQALPWRSVLEVSYVANKSRNQLLNGNNDQVSDLNSVSPGSYFTAVPGASVAGGPVYLSPGTLNCVGAGSTTFDQAALDCAQPAVNNQGQTRAIDYNYTPNNGNWWNHYRPLTQYGDVYLVTHGGYANYNSLQVSWQKQSGPITFLTNYTFSKVLGTRDGQTDNGAGNGRAVDPFNLKNNYGPLAYDHTHLLNLSYVWNLPKFVHGSRVLEGAIDGWQLSGYTTWQSGAPIQPNTGGNLNLQAAGLSYPTNGAPDIPDNTIALPNGLKSNSVNPGTWFGTNQDGGGYVVIVPQVTCDPRHHASGAYFNPNCFALPTPGHQGTLIWPYIHGPNYFDSDLGLFKSFQINERQKLQFRISAINFLNHPLGQFGLAGNSDEQLSFTQSYPVQISGAATGSAGNECAFLNLPVVNGSCTYTATKLSTFNTNGLTTGKPKFKNGSRTLTFAVKYYF
jgi:Carboxypeptidase regulatory-like domain/TonB-dependent Receptor Plug Domain